MTNAEKITSKISTANALLGALYGTLHELDKIVDDIEALSEGMNQAVVDAAEAAVHSLGQMHSTTQAFAVSISQPPLLHPQPTKE